ncbi:hypothetical protein [Streptomyces sp. NPDC058579]|uniref:hypothetical protein n=1 Tax=Streptomyces sp. NPDC058579 TaxID=3346548 RepID=UPI00365D08B3
MSQMITADLVDLDLSATTKEAAARSLAERMAAQGRVTDPGPGVWIMPGSRGLARTLAALSSVANAPR